MILGWIEAGDTADGEVVIPHAQSSTLLSTQLWAGRKQLHIERVRQVTDKPIKYVVLSHYHAVRVLGASAYKAQAIVASQDALLSPPT